MWNRCPEVVVLDKAPLPAFIRVLSNRNPDPVIGVEEQYQQSQLFDQMSRDIGWALYDRSGALRIDTNWAPGQINRVLQDLRSKYGIR